MTGLKAGDPSTTAAMNAIPAVRAEAATVARSIGAADYGVGGEAPAIYDISSISNSDLATVIPIAIVVIGILLALVMRSLVAPLYLIVSVGLSYLAALGPGRAPRTNRRGGTSRPSPRARTARVASGSTHGPSSRP